MRRFSFSWSLAAEAIRLATFSCKEPWLLIGLLAVSTVPPYVELRQPRPADAGLRAAHGALRRPAGRGLGGRRRPAADSRPPPGGRPCRCWPPSWSAAGPCPAHCWVTDWFEHASFGIALLYVVPLGGVYAAVRLVLPIGPDWVLAEHRPRSRWSRPSTPPGWRPIQRETRRFFAHLFLSHASLVLVGLELHTELSLTGVALPLVLGDPLARRLRPDAPRPRSRGSAGSR